MALDGLPSSLRNVITYPEHEWVGLSARDSISQAGYDMCEHLNKIDLTKNNMTWLRPYLLAMGGFFQLLCMVTFQDKEALEGVKPEVRQRIFMAMDLLSGCLAYSTASIAGLYTEQTRRNFLLTHGLRFISSTRARKFFKYGQSDEKMNADPEGNGGVLPFA